MNKRLQWIVLLVPVLAASGPAVGQETPPAKRRPVMPTEKLPEGEPTLRLTTEQAKSHVGKYAKVCGRSVGGYYDASSSGSPTYINLDKPYPDFVFTLMIMGVDRKKFGTPEDDWTGMDLCINGKIGLYQGLPYMIVRDLKRINIVKDTGKTLVVTAAQAKEHAGQRAKVCGKIVNVYSPSADPKAPLYINLDKPYPHQVFTLIVSGPDRQKFGSDIEAEWIGERVCVKGAISTYQGIVNMMIKDPSQLTPWEGAPKKPKQKQQQSER